MKLIILCCTSFYKNRVLANVKLFKLQLVNYLRKDTCSQGFGLGPVKTGIMILNTGKVVEKKDGPLILYPVTVKK